MTSHASNRSNPAVHGSRQSERGVHLLPSFEAIPAMTPHTKSQTDPLLAAFIGACAVLFSTAGYAAQGNSSGQSPAGAGLLVGFAIAYLTRRQAIGGWLLYFYMQLYLSFLLNLALSFASQSAIALLRPSEWDSARLYAWYVVSVVPVLLVMTTEAVIATYLLFRRSEANIQRLQTVLAVLVIAAGLSLAIDLKYFSESTTIFFDALTLVTATVWCIYFRRSKRVQLVFIEHRWNYAAQQVTKPPLTPQERRYSRNRAIVSAVITFVLLLVAMGSAVGDKKPDSGIFFVPVFYGLIAAALGWYLPISKKKRAALSVSAPTSSQTKSESSFSNNEQRE